MNSELSLLPGIIDIELVDAYAFSKVYCVTIDYTASFKINRKLIAVCQNINNKERGKKEQTKKWCTHKNPPMARLTL